MKCVVADWIENDKMPHKRHTLNVRCSNHLIKIVQISSSIYVFKAKEREKKSDSLNRKYHLISIGFQNIKMLL